MLLFLYATWLVPFAHVILVQALQNLAGASGRLAFEYTDVLFISEAALRTRYSWFVAVIEWQFATRESRLLPTFMTNSVWNDKCKI